MAPFTFSLLGWNLTAMIPNPPSVSNRIPDLPIFLLTVHQRIWDFEMFVLGFFAWFVFRDEQYEETVTGNHV